MEFEQQKQKVDKMRTNAADEYDIKKQVRKGETRRPFAGGHLRSARLTAHPRPSPPLPAQVEVLSETEIMIPDTMRRLAKGVEELKDFLVSAKREGRPQRRRRRRPGTPDTPSRPPTPCVCDPTCRPSTGRTPPWPGRTTWTWRGRCWRSCRLRRRGLAERRTSGYDSTRMVQVGMSTPTDVSPGGQGVGAAPHPTASHVLS